MSKAKVAFKEEKMKRWNKVDITKAIKKMGKTPVDEVAYDRVWFKIEDQLRRRQRPLLPSLIWKPWNHPIRWVGATACLCIAFTGFIYHQKSAELTDMAAFVDTISNPSEGITKDLGVVSVPNVLTEAPSPSIHEAFFSETSQSENPSNEELPL